MVKVCVVGTGFVGLTHAAVTAMFGHNVVGYDSNVAKVAAFSSGDKSRIEEFIMERSLAELVNEQIKAGRLTFSANPEILRDREIFFMCLPTPYTETGESDLSYLFGASDTIVDSLLKRDKQNFVLFVDKSTVPIGTAKKLNQHLHNKKLTNFDVASNPEFLPEGDAVASARHSFKIVVGANHKESFDLLKRVYANFLGGSGYIETNPETAEAIKYASNALLFTQIVSWQAIPAKIAEAFPEVDFDVMKKGILVDSRIAKWGSYVSAGAGGSCFKKDDLSLIFQLKQNGVDASFLKIIIDINEYHKTYLVERAEREANYTFNKKSVVIFGTAFKQGTNDMRESNVLKLVPLLLSKGVSQIKLYDPLALDEAKKIFNPQKNSDYSKISYCDNINNILAGTDVAIIATDHQEFKGLLDLFLEHASAPYLILDGRRMMPSFVIKSLTSKGISYLSIGGRYYSADEII
jgi:UDPglucose 6-dehydrogenase